MIKESLCDELSDEQLVAYSIQDMDYFLYLYQRYEPRLLRYIKRITQVSTPQAEDILQDAFIKVWQNLKGFDQNLKLSSWIYRIVHNETISYWRKKQSLHRNRKVILDENYPYEDTEELSNVTESDRKEQDMYKVLEQLPVPYKTVLWFKYIEEMSYREISDILKIPEGTVATRIYRAKKHFLQLAQDYDIDFN
jgi:RNA polymerase sigma-70 factor (ECF subfamily)